jgi:uncharacterized protein (TIGR02391 family)
MPSLIEYLPTADVLLELEPEDLGAILIDMLHRNRMGARFALSNIEMPLWNAQSPGYPHQKRQAVGRALAEAWAWLQTEGLMMPDPEQPNGWFCLTRRGERLKSSVDIEAYRKGSLLPASALHPGLVEKVRPMFLRGDYDDAVFKAFKTLEMAVRAIASLPDDMNAVTVMRTAFNPETGILTDKNVVPAEREALSHLFAGAMGHAKNPGSHRTVNHHVIEAAQLIGFASYLLRVVDERSAAASSA